MAVRGIPDGHLEFVINKLFVSEEAGLYLQQLRSGDAGNRAKLLASIDAVAPGTIGQLSRRWENYGGTSVHLWSLPALKGVSLKNLTRKVAGRLGLVAWTGERLPVQLESGPTSRVLWVEMDGALLYAKVRLTLERKSTYEDEPFSYDVSTDVAIRIDLADSDYLAEVWATQRNAARAIEALLEWIVGGPLPRKKQDREQYLTPLSFALSDVIRIAKRCNMWDTCGLGPDPRGKHAEVMFRSPLEGERRAPIDTSDDRAAELLASPKNDVREVGFDFTHDDDYVEYCELSFYFRTKHPHVTFRKRSSQPVVRYVLDQLRAELRMHS